MKTFFNTFADDAVATTQGSGNLIDIPTSEYGDDALDAVSAGDSKFLPRLQLMTVRSDKVAVEGFPANHFALVQGKALLDLGESVDILLIAWRPKALDMSGDEIISCYDPKFDADKAPTGTFAEIQKKSGVRDSECMYGPEFLCYVPSAKKYATFFCGSVTLRYEAPAFKVRLSNAATLRPDLITPKKGKGYYSTKVHDCTAVFDVPAREDIMKVLDAFKNPEEGPESATEEETESTGRAQ